MGLVGALKKKKFGLLEAAKNWGLEGAVMKGEEQLLSKLKSTGGTITSTSMLLFVFVCFSSLSFFSSVCVKPNHKGGKMVVGWNGMVEFIVRAKISRL